MTIVSICSEPVRRHYVTHSRTSPAYASYIAYRMSLIAVPLIIVLSCPIQLQNSSESAQPDIAYTGNYYVNAAGLESSTQNPSTGIDVAVTGIDKDYDGIADAFSMEVNANKFAQINELFFAFEVVDHQSRLGLVTGKVSSPTPGNRVSAWFALSARDGVPYGAQDLSAVLAKPGANSRVKIAAVDSPYTLQTEKFSSIFETLPNASRFNCVVYISIPRQGISSNPSAGEVFRINFIYFVAVAMATYLVLETLYTGLVRTGAVSVRLVEDRMNNSN